MGGSLKSGRMVFLTENQKLGRWSRIKLKWVVNFVKIGVSPYFEQAIEKMLLAVHLEPGETCTKAFFAKTAYHYFDYASDFKKRTFFFLFPCFLYLAQY